MTERDVMERELAAVDEALRTGEGSTVEPELAELALALAAEAPQPRPGLEPELSQRVAEGFPRKRRVGRPSLSFALPSRKVLLPAAAGLASVAVAVTVVVASREPKGTVSALSSKTAGGASSPSQLAPDKPVPTRRRAAPPAASDGFRPGAARRIERSARLALAAPTDRLRRVGDRIATVTDRYDGYVLRSSIASGTDATGGGSYELRVPARDLRAALRDLSALGTVRSLDQDGEDVTADYETNVDSLRAARAERTGLLRRLERAGSDAAADALRRQLTLNAGQISTLRGQLRAARTSTDYAAVSVRLEARDEGGAAAPGHRSGLSDAWHDALGTLGSTAEFLVRALGVALPLALLALAAWLGGRVVRRRRRDAILR